MSSPTGGACEARLTGKWLPFRGLSIEHPGYPWSRSRFKIYDAEGASLCRFFFESLEEEVRWSEGLAASGGTPDGTGEMPVFPALRRDSGGEGHFEEG
jgi:hypothetical protein